jgi:hypothetical protein
VPNHVKSEPAKLVYLSRGLLKGDDVVFFSLQKTWETEPLFRFQIGGSRF